MLFAFKSQASHSNINIHFKIIYNFINPIAFYPLILIYKLKLQNLIIKTKS